MFSSVHKDVTFHERSLPLSYFLASSLRLCRFYRTLKYTSPGQLIEQCKFHDFDTSFYGPLHSNPFSCMAETLTDRYISIDQVLQLFVCCNIFPAVQELILFCTLCNVGFSTCCQVFAEKNTSEREKDLLLLPSIFLLRIMRSNTCNDSSSKLLHKV